MGPVNWKNPICLEGILFKYELVRCSDGCATALKDFKKSEDVEKFWAESVSSNAGVDILYRGFAGLGVTYWKIACQTAIFWRSQGAVRKCGILLEKAAIESIAFHTIGCVAGL